MDALTEGHEREKGMGGGIDGAAGALDALELTGSGPALDIPPVSGAPIGGLAAESLAAGRRAELTRTTGGSVREGGGAHAADGGSIGHVSMVRADSGLSIERLFK